MAAAPEPLPALPQPPPRFSPREDGLCAESRLQSEFELEREPDLAAAS